jgi:hypothetical protein
MQSNLTDLLARERIAEFRRDAARHRLAVLARQAARRSRRAAPRRAPVAHQPRRAVA